MKLRVPISLLSILGFFLVASPSSAQERDPNINDKYIVVSVEVRGVRQRDVTPELRKELDALIGKPFDPETNEQVVAKLRTAFPGYHVDRRGGRADKRGTVRVIYFLHKPDWLRYLRFEPIHGNVLFHSDQGWGTVLPLGLNGANGNLHVMPIVTWDNADDFIEENSGFGIRVESRRLGTERLGMFLDWSTLDASWRDRTTAALAASPQLPAAYRNRASFTPMLKYGFTREVSVAGGVGITELDPLDEDSGSRSRMANVAIGSIRYKQRWEISPRVEHYAGAAVTLRKGISDLESDFVYDRLVAEGDYLYRTGRHRLFLSGMAGRITGDAPLFERFALGNSRTLRGWDKYDISPVGGNRMFHTSIEYRFRGAMLFVDAGSVWNTGEDKRVRFSTGGGFTAGPAFLTIGFPVNTDEFRAVLTLGLRFGISISGVPKF